MEDKEILLNIKVNAEQAMANIVSLTRQNEELKKGLQDLNKAEKENGKLTDEQIKTKIDLNAQIKENNAGIRENAKELKVQQSEVAKSEGSINAMRSRLRELTSAYNSMSKEMRESEVGQRVAGEMKVLNESVNTANLNVSNFKDNIGNYPQVVQSFLCGK